MTGYELTIRTLLDSTDTLATTIIESSIKYGSKFKEIET